MYCQLLQLSKQAKTLVGAFSVIVKTDGLFAALVVWPQIAE